MFELTRIGFVRNAEPTLLFVLGATRSTFPDSAAWPLMVNPVALVKVAVPMESRTTLLQVAEHYKAKVVDYGAETLMLRVHGETRKLDNMMSILSAYDVREVVRSGKIVMARGNLQT